MCLPGYGSTSDLKATGTAGFIAHSPLPVNFVRLEGLITDLTRS
jgi:hypothetical protein